jgi:lysyl-tRNA synthetase class 2
MNRPPAANTESSIAAAPDLARIRHRADLLRELRQFFDSRGFLEVQPPCLSRECVIDPYIDPLEIPVEQLQLSADQLPERLFLQTSPEAAMKRMLAAGAPSIYSLGPVFRAGEQGKLHNVEFTMLEWYEVGADLEAGIELLGQLAIHILGGERYDVRTYRELFHDTLGIDPITADDALLGALVSRVDPDLAASIGRDRDALLDVLLSVRIQPQLGIPRPLIVRNYPLGQAALARTADDDPQCAARFELFVHGIELANGYDELRDAEVLAARFARSNVKRAKAGRRPLPGESALLHAMRRGLPACAGVALGVDRLLMVRTGSPSLESVMPFSIRTA